MMKVWLWISAMAFAFGACGDDGPKKPIGEVCAESAECESGICGGGLCLDPEVDTDLDGLINRIEAGIATDPVVADTDGDGASDGAEIGGDPSAPADSDGDGRIDAKDSASADCDRDGSVDQQDATDGVGNNGACSAAPVGGDGGVDLDPTQAACNELCTAAERAGCDPFDFGGCTEECRASADQAPECGEQWITLANCVATSPDIQCAPEGGDWQYLPEVPSGQCADQLDSYRVCSGTEPARPGR